MSYPLIHEYSSDKKSSYFRSKYLSRERRHTTESKENPVKFDFSISAFGRDFHFNLSLNKDLIAPNFKLEIVGKNGTVKSNKQLKNCHYIGSVQGKKQSAAAVSNCDGLVSWFKKSLPQFIRRALAVQSQMQLSLTITNQI